MTKRFHGNEEKYTLEVLKSEFRSSKATNMVNRAESAFARKMGSQYSIGFVNGTATLHTALEALGVGVGDEVIVPPLTMSATAFAVIQAGATPVFADVDIKTWQISAESVSDVATSQTKAVISVALYGGSPDYEPLLKSCGDIPLVEDNAEAFGTTYRGVTIGNFGCMSSYSFQSSKHLTSGEGGMLLVSDEEIADKVRKIQSLGYRAVSANQGKISKLEIQDPSYLRHEILGWNYRLSDLNAAVILGQIENYDHLVGIRKDTANQLLSVIEKTDWLVPQENYKESEHSYWAFPVLLNRSDLTWKEFRDRFMLNGGKGIYAAWQLSYLEPALLNHNFLGRERFMNPDILKSYSKGLCPNAEFLQPKILAFRTNEWDEAARTIQLKALIQTISDFE
jgi:perosamine synthetase